MKRLPPQRARAQRGATLIEVLVSMLILMLGLLGLVGVMIESQRAQLESYQRSQALLLVQDMVARINANRVAADCYVQAAALHVGSAAEPLPAACAFASPTPQYERAKDDLADWRGMLLGSSERSGGADVGAVLGARGCITKDATTGVFLVSVAWQGTHGLSAPPAGIPCGDGAFGDESLRRAVSLTVLPPVAS